MTTGIGSFTPPSRTIPRNCASSIARPARAIERRWPASTLDALSVGRDREGRQWSLRWILLHLIEETARHNGHADLLREAIDGVVGE